ncbi:RPC17 RNA polymerase-like protein III subunit C17 [Dipodascopsis uninucleata]
MKIETARDKLLSNYEVIQYINSIKKKKKQNASRRKSVMKTENLETILLELQGYLKGTPAERQTEAEIRAFIKELSVYELEKAEKLQLINLAPVSMVALHSVIEECDQRFSEEEREHMLTLVNTYLHPEVTEAPFDDSKRS